MLFASIDIYPTLCGLAGVPIPKHCSGRDLSAAMRGAKLEEPQHVFILSQPEPGAGRGGGGQKRSTGQAGDEDKAEANIPVPKSEGAEACPPYRGVRTKTHTYVVADTGRWLLYDNVADPYQMKNLVNDPRQAALMQQLDVAIEGWLHSVNDSFPYATAKGKIFSLSA